jgi:hypothetical protein
MYMTNFVTHKLCDRVFLVRVLDRLSLVKGKGLKTD